MSGNVISGSGCGQRAVGASKDYPLAKTRASEALDPTRVRWSQSAAPASASLVVEPSAATAKVLRAVSLRRSPQRMPYAPAPSGAATRHGHAGVRRPSERVGRGDHLRSPNRCAAPSASHRSAFSRPLRPEAQRRTSVPDVDKACSPAGSSGTAIKGGSRRAHRSAEHRSSRVRCAGSRRMIVRARFDGRRGVFSPKSLARPVPRPGAAEMESTRLKARPSGRACSRERGTVPFPGRTEERGSKEEMLACSRSTSESEHAEVGGPGQPNSQNGTGFAPACDRDRRVG